MEEVLRVTPVVGLPQFNGWSHVWELNLDLQTKLVVCLALEGDNATNIGRDVIELIAQLPPRSAQGLYQALKEAIALCENQQKSLSVSAGIFHHHQTVLASYQSSIVLKRGAKVGTIVQSENELRIIEGKFDLDDVFVFSTQNGRQFISQISLNFERGYDSDGVITAIVPALHSLTDSSTAALAFVAVTQEEPMAESPVPTMEIDLQSNDDQESLAISLSAGQSSSKVNQELSQTTTLAQAQAAADDSGITIGQPLSSSKKQYFLHRKNILDTTLRGFAVAITIGRRLGQTGVQTATQIIQSFSSKTYLGAPPSKKMIRLAILAVVIVLFLALLGWFFWARNKQLEAAALAIAQPFRAQLAQLATVATVDPIPARLMATDLMAAVTMAQQQAEESGEKKTAAELSIILTEVKTVYDNISGRDELTELPIFYDLRLVSSDFIASQATLVGNQAMFLDSEKKTVIILNLDTKQVFATSVDSLESVRAVSPFQDLSAVLLANGLYQLPFNVDAQPVEVKEVGDSNREATLIANFGSYVYVFNPEKRNIYRYVKSGGQYSDPVGWLLDPLGVPFTSVVSWSIDGDIWLGTDSGQILKFTTGKAADFNAQGLEDPLFSPLQVVTREELNTIYILEPAKKRLVVLTKTGQFLREIKSSSLGAATTILINTDGTKAYVVSGSTVFELAV
ncbi:MAG: hypothetical protein COU66_01640 [Candidatus Pacebacteria bacterium CG10_big_fil_rev_8_21_14_0_10_44_11]|nr:MAG: hypothetical protein COU66_01640 [Candidatus Pacebacteria bacterium CG10_big_fil_rev_8_21_14_0_10_44_11]